MNHRIKISLALLANISLAANQLLAQLPPIDFESPVFVPWEPIQNHSANGWNLVSGSAKVTPLGEGVGGGQALNLEKNPQEAWLRRDVTWDPNERTAFIDFQIKPAAEPEGSLATVVANGTQIAFQVPAGAGNGQLWAFHGGDGANGSSQWFLTPRAFAIAPGSNVSSSWTRVTLRQDYDRNLWDLFIDGKLAAVNLSFEGREGELAAIDFFGSRHGDTKVDTVSAQTTNMLFPDADKDGLPDSWEIANGSNPNVYDRDAIKPGTGLSFLDNYLASLWPSGSTAANGITGAGNIGTIPPLTIMGSHQPVGALKGSFSVGGDGAASYSVPIDLPKGTGGMEPKLSLAYSSNSGNGVVGLGFAISGLQMITRGRASFKKDGFAGVENFTNDRFFLNGERLVCVAGTYGADGSEYRTEIDSFSRIRLSGNGSSGDSSWKVETKAGLILEFGTTADSRIKPAAAPAPMSWAVNKVSDTVGNYYVANYESDTTADTKELLNHRLKEIKYTGNASAGVAPYSTISFSYETRPDVSAPYTRGFKIRSSKRLKEIQVSTGGTLNHRYELGYQLSPQSQRSILHSVGKFSASGAAIPPTIIDWAQKPDTSARTSLRASTNSYQNMMEWNSGLLANSKFIDVNGDGLLDRADHHDYTSGTPGLWISLNTGRGFAPKTKWLTSSNANQMLPEWYSSTDRYSGFLDMNGDGLPDRVDHHDYITNQPGVWVSLNNGNGFGPKSRWYTSSDWRQSLVEWSSGSGRYSGFIDLNNDGLPDKVDDKNYETGQPGIWVSLNTGSGFAPKERWYTGGHANQNLLEWTSGNTMYSGFVDMNGDGMLDRVDHHDYTTNTPGLWVSLNTGSGFAAKTKWYSSTNANQNIPEWYSTTDRYSGLVDMNGDGLPDRVDHYNYQTSQSGLWVSLNTGTGFGLRQLWYQSTYVHQNLPRYSSGASILSDLIDLNGDGLPDRVDHYNYSTSQDGLWVSLNTGAGFAAKSRWYTGTSTDENMPRWGDGTNMFSDFVDMNGDGLPDRVDHYNYSTGQYGLWVSLNTGSSFLSRVRWYQSTKSEENYLRWSTYSGFIDLDSDGLPDRLDHYNYTTGQYGFWVSFNKGNGYNAASSTSYSPEVVSSITDGFGSDIQVEYKRLNDTSVGTGFNSRVYEKGPAALPAGQVALIDATLVVSRYSERDGMGGRRYKSQRYGDLRYDRNNETSLGFGWVEQLDEMNGQRSRTEMMRTYPFAGSPAKVQTFVDVTAADLAVSYPTVSPGLKLITLETAEYAELPPQTGVGGTIRRPVQTKSVKQTSDLNGDAANLGTIKIQTTTGQLLADFDAYGFVKKSTVESLDGTTVVTESAYNHNVDASRWHLGRLSGSTVVKSGAGKPTLTKNASFAYSAATGLLQSETVEPGDALTVTKSYTHDGFGNVVSTAVSASGATRTGTTEFDALGRFPVREENQLGQGVSYQYDSQKALLLSSTDTGGRTTWMHYDAFGTLIRTDHPGGTQTGEITGFATNASLPAAVAGQIGTHQIKYFRAKESSGAPVAKVYLDAMGRELVTETTILRNGTAAGTARYGKVYGVTRYDARGRKISVSLPFADGETPLFTVLSYDSFDRLLTTVHPDGKFERVLGHYTENITTFGLAPQPATYTLAEGANGVNLERWEDQHGRIIRTMDNSGQITTFHHDHEGRLVRVAINGVNLLTNTFDTFGNKTAVWEVNSGTTGSIYNGFGEVVSTRDANYPISSPTSYTYDVLGRKTSVTKPEGTYYFYYDHARGNGIGQPWKTTGPSGYEEEISYDALGSPAATRKTQFGETFTTATTYDALGRPLTATDAGGLVTLNGYDPLYSFPVSITLAGGAPGASIVGAGTVLWQAGTFDSSGRALTQTLAQGVATTETYKTGNDLTATLSAVRGGATVQNKTYEWDGLGNLTYRNDAILQRLEAFGYDDLNRVTTSQVTTTGGGALPANETYTYDLFGNLLTKGSALLSYGPTGATRPHGVISATIKNANRDYSYDAAGYVMNDTKRAYTWTSFGQLATVSYDGAPKLNDISGTQILDGGNVFTSFAFDAAGNRSRQVKERSVPGSSPVQLARETTLYLGSYEREVHETQVGAATPAPVKTVHRHSLGAVIYTRSESLTTGTTVKLTTILKDHLGSTDVLLVGTWDGVAFSGVATERQAFDPWGERRKLDFTHVRNGDGDAFATSAHDYDRGYTGHEQLDDSGLIHMNGRIYDPELGRFLSPDPYVQMPEFSQNFNRYSYVLNNPLNTTDPSGFSWLSKAFGKVGNWIKENWRTIVVIVVVVVVTIISAGSLTMGVAGVGAGILGGTATAAVTSAVGAWAVAAIGGAFLGGIAGGLSAALNGGDLGDILRGRLVGAVHGAITAGALHGMSPQGAGYEAGFNVKTAAHVAGHGVVGGAYNAAMGGSFQDGFLSSAVSAAAADAGAYDFGSGSWGVAARTAVAGIVGGTASAIGGGKFANGAFTAAFQHYLNAEGGPSEESSPKGPLLFEWQAGQDALDWISYNLPPEALGPVDGAVMGFQKGMMGAKYGQTVVSRFINKLKFRSALDGATPKSVMNSLSNNSLKHSIKHLEEFKILDPAMDADMLRKLGASIVKPENLIKGADVTRKTFEYYVKIGKDTHLIRTVLNMENKIRSIHLRY